MTGFYFIKSGKVAYVLASYNNAIISKAGKGTIIGFEDYPYYLH
jgi:hypothetical protein